MPLSSFDGGSKAIFDIADLNLLLIQLLVTSVRNVHRIVDEMRSVGFNMERVKIVCNRIGKESGSISPEYVEETLNHNVFYSIPDDWQSVSSAINMGVSLNQEHGKTRVRQSIRDLAIRIHQPDSENAAARDSGSKGVGSLFTKMFSKG